MRRMRAVHEDEHTLVLVPADPQRPNMSRDMFIFSVSERDDSERDAALGRAIRERADSIYYGPLPGTQSNFDDVGDFHERFELANTTHGGVGDKGVYDDALHGFRMRFMEEELDEFHKAYLAGDVAAMFDGLMDLVYVAMGTAQFLGLPWQEGWNEVQRANMTKVRAASAEESGQKTGRHHHFDVVKPDDFVPPDIRGVMERNGMDPSWPREEVS